MRTRTVRTLTTLALAAAVGLGAAATSVHAQSPGALTLTGAQTGTIDPQVSAATPSGRPAVTIDRTNVPPTIDGRLDDTVWQGAVEVRQFVQQRPVEGAPATERTEVRIVYDSQNIYFAIHAHYSDRSLIRANHVDRDQTAGDDNVRLYFDPFLDQQRAYVFSVNGYGVQSDSVLNSADASTGTAADLTPGVRGVVPVNNFGGTTVPAKRGGLLDRIRRAIVPQNHTSGGRRST